MESLDHKAIKVPQVPRDHKVKRENLAHKVAQDLKVLREIKDKKEIRVPQVLRVHKDYKDYKVLED